MPGADRRRGAASAGVGLRPLPGRNRPHLRRCGRGTVRDRDGRIACAGHDRLPSLRSGPEARCRRGDRDGCPQGRVCAVRASQGRSDAGRRAPRVSRLLVRDLVQLATPAGTAAPLRGHSLDEVEVIEDAYVLCEDGSVAATGRMRDLGRLVGDVEELDARGCSAVPGLVDCHTHACFAGDRVDEFALRAGGATYEELHATGGGILSTVRSTRAASSDELAASTGRHRDWMLRAGTTTFEAKSGYGLDRVTELAQLRAVRATGGVPTWLGAHAVPPEFANPDAYLDFALAEVLPEAAQLATAADVFVENGAFDVDQARRY